MPMQNHFIARWKNSGVSERANYQLFLTELCDLLGVEKPRPATDKVHEASYNLKRPVDFNDGEGKITTNYIDLYKQHCFVLEAKQGSDKAQITEAELLGADRVKTKTGTATRDTRTWERVAQLWTVISYRCIICFFAGQCTIGNKEKRNLETKGIEYERKAAGR